LEPGRPHKRSLHEDREDASAPPHAPMRPRPPWASLDGNTAPWPSPGPGQERPDAGRSPGSRVRAAMRQPSRTCRSSGRFRPSPF